MCVIFFIIPRPPRTSLTATLFPYTTRCRSLSQSILRRNGVPAGARGSLRNMFQRSLGASTFAGFWRHWNPVFGYALGRYVFAPLKRAVPSALALVATFVVCGAIHDLVIMAVRGAPAFLFTPWLDRKSTRLNSSH